MNGGTRTRDLTTGPIGRTLALFAIPTLLSNILQSLNGSINSVWVGRFLGEAALAATANANMIMFLMSALVFGFGMAAMVLVGQAFGRGDVAEARRVFAGAFGFSLMLAVAVTVVGWLAAPAILRSLATPDSYFPLALAYLRVIFLAIPGMLLFIMMMMGLRGAGDSMTPLWFMILSVILDSGLNPVFILGLGPAPRLGIAGSGVATAIANYVSAAALLVTLYARDLPLRLKGRELRWLRPSLGEIRVLVAKGLPMGLQMIVISAAGLVFIGLVNREGLLTTAAYAASQQVWTYMQMPAMAIGAAASAMAAQNVGAGRWDRVNAIARSGLGFHLLVTGSVLALILAFDRPVLALFLGSASPAIDIARHIQFLASWTFLFFGCSMVLFGVMRANGAVIAPLLILCISMFPIRLAAYYLGYPVIGSDALWLSMPAGSLFAVAAAIAVYLKGGWRRATMAVPPARVECEEHIMSEAMPAGRMKPTG
jgi:putative MATE family efflux protein